MPIGSKVKCQTFNYFFDDAISCFLRIHVLFREFKGHQGVWNGFVLEGLGLAVEKLDVRGLKRVENVLGGRDKLAGFCIDLDDEVEKLDVEWEVLDVVRQADHADNQLDEWMHKHCKLTDFGICKG